MVNTFRRRASAMVASALALTFGLGTQPPRAFAAERTATLVGSLQDELGCSSDWQLDCEKTQLTKQPNSSIHSTTVTIPAGSWEYKVAIDKSWDEAYGEGDGNAKLVLEAPAEVELSYDDETHQIGLRPTKLAGAVGDEDKKLATDSLREAVTKERFYFLMADRFANGSTANDTGGIPGDRMKNGFDPSDKGFYHGGDLKGVINKLDYIKGMGTTAIWLTPSFKNRPVQGTGENASAGYHGYWITDFTQIDPHLGTNDDMKQLINQAHAKGMKVYFDIITNHTADVIDNAQKSYSYVSKDKAPYRDASGKVFDDAEYAGKADFPALDAATSFPLTPVVAEADKDVKVPAWLNDPTMYHNRGDSTYAGESSTYGDFSGLDDLFTERPEVIQGMTDIYKTWAAFGIDGFRIDTVKHVNTPFWSQFSPAVTKAATDAGTKDFFMFGEVYDSDPKVQSTYTTAGKLSATLDFGFQGAAVNAVQGKATAGLRDFFASDDWYTDTDSNAYQLPTFLGNHDMGRIGMMLSKAGYSGDELLKRTQLANSLMFLVRGNPITYYGDEQGFIGAGGDKDSRQDMFGTRTAQYQAEQLVGGGTMGTGEHYSTTSPMYRQISQLSKLRQDHPALADGAQIHRFASSGAGIYAFSRIDRTTGTEYVVGVNNSDKQATASFQTYLPNGKFVPLHGSSTTLASGKDSRVSVSLPALSVGVWKAKSPLRERANAPAVQFKAPTAGAVIGNGRTEISASVPENTFAQVSFAWRPVGTSEFKPLGTDDNAPYRVFADTSSLPQGSLVEYRAIVKDSSGNVNATSTYAQVGTPKPASTGDTGNVGPVTQPDAVSVPGSHNSEMGCTADWSPECDKAQLTLDAKDQVWKGTFQVPAAEYAYKAAIHKSWDENYGAGGAAGGSNVTYNSPGTVTFYYDHARHYVTSDAQGPIITAPGSFQSKLGCSADWSPDCMQPWLVDADGDGVYTWSSAAIPAGNYEFKIAEGLSWDTSYGDGGTAGGNNMTMAVPADGTVMTISYDAATHKTTVTASKAGAAPDLKAAKAIWLDRDTIAWPASSLPKGADPASLDWRLHWSKAGNLRVDAETLVADDAQQADLTWNPAGISADVLAKHPELKGYLALDLDKATAKKVPQILTGQVAVAMYDDLGALLDATGVQIPKVLDDLYGKAASGKKLGASFSSTGITFRVWAPTAQQVNLLTWPAGSPDQDASKATRVPMKKDATGTWQAITGKKFENVRYLYEVKVFVPAEQKVVTSQVTDPYSVALTLNSTRSVAVNLDSPQWKPQQWAKTASPKLAQNVDSTIYELHVRDFSIQDKTVPAADRGSYKAFASNGDGTKHLRQLATAGLNTVHLLPTFDIATIEEDEAKQKTPPCDLASYAPDSKEQQACIQKIADADGYNWGYDPLHYLAPEGSYASTTSAADGGNRVAEFRTMVGALHANGLRVVLDQVYNHTPASGQDAKSVLDKVVPGYYQRLDAKGAVYTSTCCQNTATEHTMMGKLMVDSTVLWAKAYKVDGFRYDLMGHHSVENMKAVRAALDKLTLAKDGVDGKSIYLYGEGWNFGEVEKNALFTQASQGQLNGTGIGTFSDRLRDAVRGGGPFDEDPRKQGFGSGEASDPNGAPINSDAAKSLDHDMDLVQLGLAGNLEDYSFRTMSGAVKTGAQVDYNGAPAGYASEPGEVISYVDAHDNETLWDSLTMKLPSSTSMDDRVRMNTLSLATTALAQTPSFWHAGADLLRSKSLDRNSYNSGDWFNTLDWTGSDNGFGKGLPPEADNAAKYGFMQPLLADAKNKPSQEQVQQASSQATDLLALRFSSKLFRLGSAEQIKAKVSYPVSGTTAMRQGVLVQRIDDTVGTDADPALKGLVVVYNTTPHTQRQPVAGVKGASFQLSPVQAKGSDDVVKKSSFDAASGTFTVPPRTVAVFVQK
ncbi:pullulanase-type alpha-1,6-glucosidase [Luteococcus japonicus]|uniref:Pullulanase-type alpha-1,6-glucosidase n=1 Tax=Luteococcus japonicus TaxID=33984 RepID=A0A3N1ZUV8_9ACTN|nr:pullulanase-type alpha-1,6-glucosidase [Luteococcus japonicus]ROR54629.1 pullulanase-type alpha-1,6-glucosidase [Luteococcus japonicus]